MIPVAGEVGLTRHADGDVVGDIMCLVLCRAVIACQWSDFVNAQ